METDLDDEKKDLDGEPETKVNEATEAENTETGNLYRCSGCYRNS